MYESMVFYKSFYDAIQGLDAELQAEIYNAVFRYGLYGEELELSPIANTVFTLIKPQIDANNKRKENGKKGAEYGKLGGRPKKNNPDTTPNKPQNNPTQTPNVNVNANANVNDIKDNIGKPDYTSEIKQVIDYLNESTDAKFSYDRKDTRKNITARLKEGYSLDDFKKVIDYKADKWRDDEKMREYLRPQTLFSPSHFESYLNEANRDPIKPKPKKENMFNNYDQNNYDFDELERRLIGNG